MAADIFSVLGAGLSGTANAASQMLPYWLESQENIRKQNAAEIIKTQEDEEMQKLVNLTRNKYFPTAEQDAYKGFGVSNEANVTPVKFDNQDQAIGGVKALDKLMKDKALQDAINDPTLQVAGGALPSVPSRDAAPYDPNIAVEDAKFAAGDMKGPLIAGLDSKPTGDPYQKVTSLIKSGEGDYYSYNKGVAGDSSGESLPPDITIGEIRRRQKLPKNHKDRLFAVGAYQFIPGTLDEAIENTPGIDNSTVFNESTQEDLAKYLFYKKRPEVGAYLRGEATGPKALKAAQRGLAKEFASVIDPDTGKSLYVGKAGNKGFIKPDDIAAALQGIDPAPKPEGLDAIYDNATNSPAAMSLQASTLKAPEFQEIRNKNLKNIESILNSPEYLGASKAVQNRFKENYITPMMNLGTEQRLEQSKSVDFYNAELNRFSKNRLAQYKTEVTVAKTKGKTHLQQYYSTKLSENNKLWDNLNKFEKEFLKAGKKDQRKMLELNPQYSEKTANTRLAHSFLGWTGLTEDFIYNLDEDRIREMKKRLATERQMIRNDLYGPNSVSIMDFDDDADDIGVDANPFKDSNIGDKYFED